MDERILDIVIYMASQLSERESAQTPLTSLADDLQSQGFTESEISSACSWMFDHFGGDFTTVGATESRTRSYQRVLSRRERAVITADAFGYLRKLVALGIVADTEMEDIIEACVQAGRHDLTREDMKFVVTGALFGDDAPLADRATSERARSIN